MYKHDATEDDEESVDDENEDDFESETDNTFSNPSQAKENSEHEEVVELEEFVVVDLKVYAPCMNLNLNKNRNIIGKKLTKLRKLRICGLYLKGDTRLELIWKCT